MKGLVFYFLLVLCALGVGARATEDLDHGEHVVALDREKFDGLKDSHDFVFMKMYAPWCGHCVKMKEDWAAVGELFKDGPVRIGAWNMEKDREVAREFDVKGFPTLLLHNLKTGETTPYPRQARTLAKMSAWISEMTGIATKN